MGKHINALIISNSNTYLKLALTLYTMISHLDISSQKQWPLTVIVECASVCVCVPIATKYILTILQCILKPEIC